MLQPTDPTPIPAMTHVVAHAAFPNGSLAIRLRNAFGQIFNDAAWSCCNRMGSKIADDNQREGVGCAVHSM